MRLYHPRCCEEMIQKHGFGIKGLYICPACKEEVRCEC